MFGSRSWETFSLNLSWTFPTISQLVYFLCISTVLMFPLVMLCWDFIPILLSPSFFHLLFKRNKIQRLPLSPYNFAKISLDIIISKEITNCFLDRASNFLSKEPRHIGAITNAVHQAAMQHSSLSLDRPDCGRYSNWGEKKRKKYKLLYL